MPLPLLLLPSGPESRAVSVVGLLTPPPPCCSCCCWPCAPCPPVAPPPAPSTPTSPGLGGLPSSLLPKSPRLLLPELTLLLSRARGGGLLRGFGGLAPCQCAARPPAKDPCSASCTNAWGESMRPESVEDWPSAVRPRPALLLRAAFSGGACGSSLDWSFASRRARSSLGTGEAAWGWLSGLPSAAAGPAVSPAGTAASPASPPPSLLCPSLVASAAAAGGIVSAAGSAHVALPGREPALLPSPAGSGKGAAATPSTAAAAGPVALVGRDPALLPPLASLAMPEGCGEERGAAGSAHAALVGREPALLLPLPLPAVAAAAASAAGVASAAGSAHAALVGREPALLLPLSAAAATAPVVAAAEPLALFSLGRAKKLPDAVPLLVMVRTWASASPAPSPLRSPAASAGPLSLTFALMRADSL
mmetsp:Transcript_20330/g.52859  ORF Transcript_20330/g.52859 Transcript_20330/m.52859 type:complete len:420 (-) Transcript_20330:7677-8936(-)